MFAHSQMMPDLSGLTGLTTRPAPAAVRDLFRTTDPQAPRCFSVLDGINPRGQLWVDNPNRPHWGFVLEPFDRTLYVGGRPNKAEFSQALADLRCSGEILMGLWDTDAVLAWLPTDTSYDGRTLEFYSRARQYDLTGLWQDLPAGCRLEPIGRNWIEQTEWGPSDVQFWGGIEAWEKGCRGYALILDDTVVSEALAGPVALGVREPGVFTKPEFRGRGYGTLVSARLIAAIESEGSATYWNCAKTNSPSVAIARRLGYTIEKEYRCLQWPRLAA